MLVIRNAEAQLAGWSIAVSNQVPVIRVDFYRRSDLAAQYKVARPPALVLLDASGKVVWKQDLGLSDEAPLDLDQAQSEVEALIVCE